MNGWIKLHRQFMEWEWYTDQNAKSVFIHCLLMANVEDKEWRGVKINRGSFITSIGKISINTGLSIKSIRVALDKLKKTSEILTEGASQWTMITVCKYECYQSGEGEQGQTIGQTKGKRRANEGQQLKKDKKEKKEEEVFAPAQIEGFEKFKKWITKNATRVSEMKQPFTISEYVVLVEDFKNKKLITDLLTSMHNYQPLLKKNISANLTFRNWAKRENPPDENIKPVKYFKSKLPEEYGKV